jgi:hypothetical protein
MEEQAINVLSEKVEVYAIANPCVSTFLEIL